MIYRRLLFLLLIASFALTACGAENSNEDNKLNVVATTGQIHDALHNIAGDKINLIGLLGPGVDPHLYVPTASNVTTFSNADLIFYNGLHLEAQMSRVMEQMEKRGIPVVPVGDRLPAEQLLSWDASAPHDPHIWNDPQLWSEVVIIIRDNLIEADPENKAFYEKNSDAYLAEIAETDEYIKSQIALIPEDKRIMITAHDAFGYFARAYGLEVRGLQGISTESEASTADVQALAKYIATNQIPAIFIETSVSPRNIEAVQAAVQAEGFNVKIGGTLYSDALAETGNPASTYTGMLRHNAETLAKALGN